MESGIELANVSRIFKSREFSVTGIAEITLTIPAHTFLVIAGPSGSGKTTLLNLIGGLDRPTSGDIFLDNLSLKGMDEHSLSLYRRNHVGFIFQGNNLIPSLTVFENVEFPLLLREESNRKEKVYTILNHVGLPHRANSFPQDLSGGEQQRIAIARALVHSPSIVLADEPTANLDSKTSEDIFYLLQEMNRIASTIVLLATHDSKLINKAKKKLMLHDGRVQSEENKTREQKN